MRSLLIILAILLANCSFDNKSGIWNNSNNIKTDNKRFENFRTLYTEEKTFNLEISPPKDTIFNLSPIKKIDKWEDEFFSDTNNLTNYDFKNLNNLIFKSKKLSRHKINDKILFDGNFILVSDIKGNIIVSSLDSNQKLYKFNFYKNKFKKIKKILNIIIQDNIAYVSDNIGYVYALDYVNKKIIWAQNYKIPFRSNLKIYKNKIVLADQNNNLYVIDKLDGKRIKIFPTEENILKNNFSNSISLYNNSIIFLNTYGSLYSLNIENLTFNWFLSLNKILDAGSINLFFSNPVVAYKERVIVSTDPTFYIIDISSGYAISKTNVSSLVTPIISKNLIYFITNNNLLVCMNLLDGKIIYSINIDKKIANFLDSKEKKVDIQSLFFVNGKLNIFLKNSYVLIFDAGGKIFDIYKLDSKISSFPIFIEENILYLDKKNKLKIYN